MTALADFPMAQAGPAVPGAVRTADQSGVVRDHAKAVRSWPLLVLAVPAAAEVWSGWVGIAQKTGFGMVSLLPGIWPWLHLDTAVTLPVGVECYAAYALRAWLATGHAISDRTRRFAKRSAIFSFALGMAGQVAFHLMDQDRVTRAPWLITMLVSCLPVLVLGVGTALAHMLREDAAAAAIAARTTGPVAHVPPDRSSAGQHEDQTDQNPPDRTSRPGPTDRARALPRRGGGRAAAGPAVPVPRTAELDIENARGIARELVQAGQRISRRALRSRGVTGSNETLNVLALTLSAELANGAETDP
jgi:hypothetical protein